MSAFETLKNEILRKGVVSRQDVINLEKLSGTNFITEHIHINSFTSRETKVNMESLYTILNNKVNRSDTKDYKTNIYKLKNVLKNIVFQLPKLNPVMIPYYNFEKSKVYFKDNFSSVLRIEKPLLVDIYINYLNNKSESYITLIFDINNIWIKYLYNYFAGLEIVKYDNIEQTFVKLNGDNEYINDILSDNNIKLPEFTIPKELFKHKHYYNNTNEELDEEQEENINNRVTLDVCETLSGYKLENFTLDDFRINIIDKIEERLNNLSKSTENALPNTNTVDFAYIIYKWFKLDNKLDHNHNYINRLEYVTTFFNYVLNAIKQPTYFTKNEFLDFLESMMLNNENNIITKWLNLHKYLLALVNKIDDMTKGIEVYQLLGTPQYDNLCDAIEKIENDTKLYTYLFSWDFTKEQNVQEVYLNQLGITFLLFKNTFTYELNKNISD